MIREEFFDVKTGQQKSSTLDYIRITKGNKN